MKRSENQELFTRDISWLAFNARVLQEAGDTEMPIAERLKFLGIFSNNLDEFFRVRVAALNRMMMLGKNAKMHLEENPEQILKRIQDIVMEQQRSFEKTFQEILGAMKEQKVSFLNDTQLNAQQRNLVQTYFNEKVRTNIFPLMIESIPELPNLHDKSIYMACMLGNTQNSFMNSYALIEVPTDRLPRFFVIPGHKGYRHVILLEDIIRCCLPELFTQFGFDLFEGYIIKVTRDAELDIDDDLQTNVIERIEKGLKNRKKGKAVRLVYDKTIQKNLLAYLCKLLNLTRRDHLIPGGRIHNFKDFMDFPADVFHEKVARKKPFVHPLLHQPIRILNVLDQRDVMLHFPYHSFDSIIDLLREAAIDPFVETIKITCYRLAKESKVVNALVNAVRNGKKVLVVLELRARFDEEANLRWKRVLEDEGVRVIHGLPTMKVHAKLCLITKKVGKVLKSYGFVSTGNLNENTARVYGDHCLLTSNKKVMADVSKVFHFIEKPVHPEKLKVCKTLIVSPVQTRSVFQQLILQEQKMFKEGKEAGLQIKLNSLADEALIRTIYKCAQMGMNTELIIRGICCAHSSHPDWKKNIHAISIVDEFLEHARVIHFKAQDLVFISSADWMVRNIDHRVEASVPVLQEDIKKELKDILDIQLKENVKARLIDNDQRNGYKTVEHKSEKIRSQVEIYEYLKNKKY